MELRELKALEIAARSKVTFNGECWVVPSQTGANSYHVTIDAEPFCSCEDFSLRQQPCKHIIAARLVNARDGKGPAPVIVTDAVPKRPTYRQNWGVYNLAQQTEKHRFQALLFDLCRGIQEPPLANPTKGGRPRVPMPDMVFSSVFKIYSMLSCRRFACDLKDAHARGYLSHLMNSVSTCTYLESALLTPALSALIVRSSLPLKSIETSFAPDSTGFSTNKFVRWYDEKYGKERIEHDWVKAHVICGAKTGVITAVEIAGRDAHDSPMFKPLVDKTAESFKIEDVCADKAYLSNDNLALVAKHGGTAYVPFKSNSTPGEPGSLWEKMFGYYQFRREDFLKHYHQRSLIESTFSAVKRKFGDSIRSKTPVAMKNEVLGKLLAHNLCVLIMSQTELGIEPVFWPDEKEAETPRNVLQLVRPG